MTLAPRLARWARGVCAGAPVCLFATGAPAQTPTPAPVPQNPSPMVEHTRRHERIEEASPPGLRYTVEGLLRAPIRIYVPEGVDLRSSPRLLVHFHGSAFIPEHAVSTAGSDYVLAAVHLGAGSGVYEHAFRDPAAFGSLMAAVEQEIAEATGIAVSFRQVVLSGFSAGHGAIRAILGDTHHLPRIGGVLLLDGLHTGYLPPSRVLHEGGRLDTSKLDPFEHFARQALRGEKQLLITHSEIFPGTFASTTETTDHLVQALGLRRTPVLRWGPLGMQQLSEVCQGSLAILGFAGNSAPDHIDHFHGMYHFLDLYDRLPDARANESCAERNDGPQR